MRKSYGHTDVEEKERERERKKEREKERERERKRERGGKEIESLFRVEERARQRDT